MSKLILSVALLALAVTVGAQGAKGQTTFEPLTTLCSRTTSIQSCSNVPSVDGEYSFSFAGSFNTGGSVAVYKAGVLVLTANDLILSTVQLKNDYYDNVYEVKGTFTGGSFTIIMEVITRRSGAGRYIQTTHYSQLDSKWTDAGGNEFTSVVTLD